MLESNIVLSDDILEVLLNDQADFELVVWSSLDFKVVIILSQPP